MMQSKFGIAVSSELMAILSIVNDLADLRKRLDEITVAFDKKGKPVTTGDLEVGGAMAPSCAIHQPHLAVHGRIPALHGPCRALSPISPSASPPLLPTASGLKMFDYHVTESGFAADIGFEKFWNVKCRYSGLKPNVSVLTTTIRALKMHGGGPKVVAGLALPEDYTKENLGLVEKGVANMIHHIKIIRKSGINPVVCINSFHTDTKDEIAMVRRHAEKAGARCAVSTHWAKGGDGALELADAVIDACNEKTNFKFLYPMEMKLRDRVDKIAKEVYGADGVSWTAGCRRPRPRCLKPIPNTTIMPP